MIFYRFIHFDTRLTAAKIYDGIDENVWNYQQPSSEQLLLDRCSCNWWNIFWFNWSVLNQRFHFSIKIFGVMCMYVCMLKFVISREWYDVCIYLYIYTYVFIFLIFLYNWASIQFKVSIFLKSFLFSFFLNKRQITIYMYIYYTLYLTSLISFKCLTYKYNK